LVPASAGGSSLAKSSIVELLNLALWNGVLVPVVLSVELILAEDDSDHCHISVELEVVQTLLEGFVLVHDFCVGDLGGLVKSLHSVLDEFS